MTALCRTCRIRPARVRGECLTCYHYRRRTRKRRPRELDTPERLYQSWVRAEERTHEPVVEARWKDSIGWSARTRQDSG